MIRRAEVTDAAAIAALEVAFPERERWSERTWAGELAASDRAAFVAVDSGIVGAALVQATCDTADLHRVVVAPGARRRGLARSLLDAGSTWAASQGAVRMLLEVRPDNAAALGLYEGEGFGVVATRTDYYAPGVDGLVMERSLADHAGAGGMR